MNKKGFTLIELMVVISIISLLSSVVMATVSTARDKAKVAAGQRFASHNHGALYDTETDLQSSFSFDTCGGTTVPDEIGSNMLTLGNPAQGWSSDTPSRKGCSMSFNIPSPSNITKSLSFSKPVGPQVTASGGGFTISYWYKSNSSGRQLIFSNRGVGQLTFEVSSGKAFLWGGSGLSPVTGNGYVNDDKWHHMTWSIAWSTLSTATVSIYIDGKVDYSASHSGIGPMGTNPTAFIGHDPGNTGGGLVALLDDFRIYNKAITTAEAQRLYASALAEVELARK